MASYYVMSYERRQKRVNDSAHGLKLCLHLVSSFEPKLKTLRCTSMFDQRGIARSQKAYHMYWIEICELNARFLYVVTICVYNSWVKTNRNKFYFSHFHARFAAYLVNITRNNSAINFPV